MKTFAATACCVLVLLLSACQKPAPANQAMPPPEVVVATPLLYTLTEWDEYTGRFEASERIEVRARVSGFLDEKRFKDGDMVKAGQVLYLIDQRPFQIALQRAEAQYELAEKELARLEGLSASRSVSKEDVDRAIQGVRVAKSYLDEARLNLEFTEVKSPIDGRISRSRIDVGNLITAGASQPLTTVVSVSPIYFYMEASEQALLKYIRLDQEGKRKGSRDNPRFLFVRLQDEQNYGWIGLLDFVDVELDRGTGTIQARAVFDNPDEVLYPGLFGRARLAGSGAYEAVLIPDHIIGTDQSKKFVMVVTPENVAEARFVELGPLQDDGMRIVRSGLSADDLVIVNGLQRARPGMTVTTREEPLQVSESQVMPSAVDIEAARLKLNGAGV